jgi:Flp pilus assembly protein TadG
MIRVPRGQRTRGQAIAELALVAPLFFAMVFGVIDLGRVIWANDVVGNAAREGARFASVHAGTVGTRTTPMTADDIRAHAMDFVIAGGVDTTIAVCFSAVHISSEEQGCSGDDSEDGAAFQRGNLVHVTVTSHVPILTGTLIGLGTFTVTGESVVLINN